MGYGGRKGGLNPPQNDSRRPGRGSQPQPQQHPAAAQQWDAAAHAAAWAAYAAGMPAPEPAPAPAPSYGTPRANLAAAGALQAAYLSSSGPARPAGNPLAEETFAVPTIGSAHGEVKLCFGFLNRGACTSGVQCKFKHVMNEHPAAIADRLRTGHTHNLPAALGGTR